MMFPDEALGGSPVPESAPAPVSSPDPTPAPESAPASSDDQPTQALSNPAVPKSAPELSLREKIQQKAAEVAARRPKDPVTGKFLTQTPDPNAPPVPGAPAQKPAVLPQNGLPLAPAGAFTPNYKVKVMEQDRDIPEILRPLMKDEASAKAVKEIMEKAYGLDYVKPKLEETRAQLTEVSGVNQKVFSQIKEAQQLFQANDIDGWLRKLQVPEERILQWVADKLEYSKLPPEQRAILDARRSAETRAMQAEQQAGYFQQQHEQTLNTQVQMGLDSVLARPDVDVVAKAYDTRMGKPGAFKAELNRRGDYYWKITNKTTPPEQLAQELIQILGPMAPAAQAPALPNPQVPVAAPAPAAQAPRTPVIPNISGRSSSALPPTVKSIADIKAKAKQFSDARRGV